MYMQVSEDSKNLQCVLKGVQIANLLLTMYMYMYEYMYMYDCMYMYEWMCLKFLRIQPLFQPFTTLRLKNLSVGQITLNLVSC